MFLMLPLGLVAIGWAGYSVITGKGYYKGCPPGGYDRDEYPFSFWIPTIMIFGLGVFVLMVSFGVIHVHSRQ